MGDSELDVSGSIVVKPERLQPPPLPDASNVRDIVRSVAVHRCVDTHIHTHASTHTHTHTHRPPRLPDATHMKDVVRSVTVQGCVSFYIKY